MADSTLYQLKQQISHYPTIEPPELEKMFDKIEILITESIALLVENTQLIEYQVLDLAGQVAGGLTRGKSIYKRSLMDPHGRETAQEDVPEIDAPVIAFYSIDDQQFLEQCGVLVTCLSDKLQVCNILQNLKLSRAVYESFIDTFLNLTTEYCSDVIKLSQHKLANTIDSQLDMRIANTESLVIGDHWTLFNVREEVFRKHIQVKLLREKIIKAYLRLAMRISQDLSQQSTTSQAIDNYQNGAIGLDKAISYYDQHSGHRFASYASWWIRQAVLLHLKEYANFVHLPIGTWQAYTWLETVVKPKIQARKGIATRRDIQEESGYTEQQLSTIYESVKLSQVFSLDYPLGDEQSDVLMSIIPSENEAEAKAELDETRQTIKDLLKSLTPVECKVICMNFGLLEYIPNRGIPVKAVKKERIRQILAKRSQDEYRSSQKRR